MSEIKKIRNRRKGVSPWAWIPTLYMAEGAPYFVVNTLAVLYLSQMGLGNGDVAMLTAWMYLPWVIKPFWSPLLDLFGRKRLWVVMMQFIVAVALGGLAFVTNLDDWLQSSLAFFWLCAFASATHDIAADGLYILALSSKEQSFFVGIRNTFYRISMVLCQWGCLRIVDSMIEGSKASGNAETAIASSWGFLFGLIATLFVVLAFYHLFLLPKSDKDVAGAEKIGGVWKSLTDNFRSFAGKFTVKEFVLALLFIFTYRLGEAQLCKISMLFMKDNAENGGLGLSLGEVGDIYGFVGVVALIVGGIIGGISVSRYGLKKMMFPMLLMMNVPNVAYVLLGIFQPNNYFLVSSLVAIEQFGYGFGFTAFTLYLVYISRGEYSTTHYAICTGLMALGMMLPGMLAGYMQESLGYTNFFIWVCVCTIPPFFIAPLLKIDRDFGIK